MSGVYLDQTLRIVIYKSQHELFSRTFSGNLNFNLINDDDVGDQQVDKLLGTMEVQCIYSDEALIYMQAILLNALKKYWLPRHIIHIMKNAPQVKQPIPIHYCRECSASKTK